MQKLFATLLFIGATFLSSAAFAQNASLEFQWKIDGFDRPESVIPSADKSEIYVSNINGPSNKQDGNGYISRISLDGKVIEKKWITGLDGPRGFALDNSKLYISDVTGLVTVDINTGQIVNRVPVAGAGFLNDVSVVNGRVFFPIRMVTRFIHIPKKMG